MLFEKIFHNLHRKKYLLVIKASAMMLFYTGSPMLVYPQADSLVYRGAYRIGGDLAGKAEYSYRMHQQDTVKNGPFSFQYFIERFREADSVQGIAYRGYFSDNQKHGDWLYNAKQLTISGAAEAENSRIFFAASGTEFIVNTQFTRGKANGFHELIDRTVVDSEPTDTTFYSQLQYENGHVNGQLRGFTADMHVTGQFDEEGFPNGDWIFTHQIDSGRTIEELRVYDHGFFSKHYYKIADEILEIKHIGFDTLARSGLGLLTRFPTNSAYFRALDYTGVVMDTTAFEDIGFVGMQRYISRANAYLQQVFMGPANHEGKNVWTAVDGSDTIGPIRVKISKFAFSEDELLINRENEKVMRETKSLITHFLEDPNTQLGRYANQELAFYYEVLRLFDERIDLISPLITFLADSASEYVDHEAILKHNAVAITYPDTVSYTFQDRAEHRHYPFPPGPANFKTADFNTYLKLVLDHVGNIIREAEKAGLNHRAESDLHESEKTLVALRDSISRHFADTSQAEDYNALHRDISGPVLAYIESAFQAYGAMSTYQRILSVDSVAACFQQFLDLYGQLVTQHTKLVSLDAEYMRSVWNAYTFTYMEERVKERLYTAFDQVMLPHLWHVFKTNLGCEGMSQQLAAIDELLARMAALRLQDTRQLEQQIRRSPKEAQAYLALLELKGGAYGQ